MKRRQTKKQNVVTKIPRNIIRTGDYKYFDTGIGADIPSTTSGAIVIPSINIVPTGSLSTNRVGKRIRIFKIEYQLQFTRGYEANSTVSASNSRTCLVLDNATKGASPSYTDIFESASINSFLNASNTSRFTILKDGLVTLNNYVVYNTNITQFDAMAFTKRVCGSFRCNIPILFSSSGSTGSVAQTVANCILLTFIGDNVKTALVAIGTSFRIYFTDD